MKIGLYSNLTRDIGARYTKVVYNILLEKKVTVLFSNDLIGIDFGSDNGVNYYDNYNLAKESDVVIVLGGDGTILGIAKECATFNTPIFAVNLGHKGFLSEGNKEDLVRDFNDLFSGNYILDKRKLLKATIVGSSTEYFALNDIVVAQSLSRIIKAEITVNGTLVDKYTSDGIIVATPTGSTAYSLSAGGPIVAPDVSCFIISPICAHSLHSRPLIVSSSSTVTVKILSAEPSANVNVDGQIVNLITNGNEVKITDSELSVSFIRRPSFNFYEKLLEKMRYWSSIEV